MVMVDPGNQPADVWSHRGVVGSLEERALECHRPGRSSGTHVRQRLFDTDGPVRSLDDENEIEIPIPDFVNPPALRRSAQQGSNLGQRSDQGGYGVSVEDSVGGRCVYTRHGQLPAPVTASTPPKTSSGSAAFCCP